MGEGQGEGAAPRGGPLSLTLSDQGREENRSRFLRLKDAGRAFHTRNCLPQRDVPNLGDSSEQSMKTRKRKELGQYIVADPEICHGQLTFKGTRIMVKSVLEMLAKGWDWDRISAAYDGRINHAAIAEVLSLAGEALIEKAEGRQRAA